MRLVDLLNQSDCWADPDATIYVAQPWSCEAEAILVSPAPNMTDPVQFDGKSFQYFLETDIARAFIEGYAQSDEGKSASERQRCERLILYAQNDA